MILERPEEPGKKYAIAFTVIVHVLLVAALFLGVQWKRSPPEVLEVELWSPQPRIQAAPPPPPEGKPEPKPEPKPEVKPEPPPPKKPDIALKEEKKKPEPKKPEPPKPEPKPEPKKPEPKPEPAKKVDFSEMLKSDERQRASTQAAATTAQMKAAAESEARSAADRRGLESYANKIRLRIKNNISMLPTGIQGNPQAIFEMRVLPSGDILQPITLKKSSGNLALDAVIERAIIKSSPLPKPDSGSFPNPFEIKYKPFEE